MTKPLFSQDKAINHFGRNCSYKFQETTEPSYLHTIRTGQHTVFLEEWFNENDRESDVFTITVYEENKERPIKSQVKYTIDDALRVAVENINLNELQTFSAS